jgi:3'-5' exoribonuclease
MMTALHHLLKEVKDEHLSSLIDLFFKDQEFVARFKRAPAAKNFHHNYLGGLLEHTLSVCRMAKQVATHYPELNGELLVTAAFLHDIGKMRELKADLQIQYSDEGRLVGHVVLGTAMVDEKFHELKDFPQGLAVRLRHLILSHHGEYAFGSPKRPKFLEAFALHLIDDLDAKLNGLARFMDRDQQMGTWTDYHRLFERYFLKGRIQRAETDVDEPAAIDEGNEAANDRQGTLFSS